MPFGKDSQRKVKAFTLILRTSVDVLLHAHVLEMQVCTLKGVWERYSEHITRVKYEWDLHILQGTLHNYQTMLQYMYDSIHTSGTGTDSE